MLALPDIVLGLGHPLFELGPLDPISFAGAGRWCRLLTFPSGQSQKDFGTRKFPSLETWGLQQFNFISFPGFEAATPH